MAGGSTDQSIVTASASTRTDNLTPWHFPTRTNFLDANPLNVQNEMANVNITAVETSLVQSAENHNLNPWSVPTSTTTGNSFSTNFLGELPGVNSSVVTMPLGRNSTANLSTTVEVTPSVLSTSPVTYELKNLIPGQQINNNVNGNFSNYIHQNIPLSAQVPDNLKKEIWSGEYVDLSSIQVHEKEFSLVLMASGKSSRRLGFKESTSNQLMSIDQWLYQLLWFIVRSICKSFQLRVKVFFLY